MKIRSAVARDLKGCVGLLKTEEFRLSDGSYPTVDTLKGYLHKGYFIVAEDGGKVVGCLIGELLKPKIVILLFFVTKKNFRGGGIGKMLISEFEKRGKDNGVGWIILYCPCKSKLSLDFYRKQRYKKGKCFFELHKKL